MPYLLKYWGRKAGEISSPYIEKYSLPGELVLDPFGGSGEIVKTALGLGRRAIYNDLNPLAYLIARVEIEGAPNHELMKFLSYLKDRKRFWYLKDGKKHWLKNPYLLGNCEIRYFQWDGDKIVKIKCKDGRELNTVIEDLEGEPIYSYPKDKKFYYPSGFRFLKRRQVDYVKDLFTVRNLIMLSAMLKDINKYMKKRSLDERVKNAIKLSFISAVYNSSKMYRPNHGSFGVPSYWIPKKRLERNPYDALEWALKRIKEGEFKVESLDKVLRGEGKISMLNLDAKELPLPDKSADLIITDPPFTDEIQYFELSYLACSWLDLSLDFSNEIIVNPKQGKDLKKYMEMLETSFSEMYRVLKRGKHAVIMIHEENDHVVYEILERIKGAGFSIERQVKEKMVQRNVGDRDTERGKELSIFVCKKD